MLKNMKIKTKLLTTFSIIIVSIIFIAVLSVSMAMKTNSTFNNLINYPEKGLISLKDAYSNFIDMRRNAISTGVYLGDSTKLQSLQTNCQNAYQSGIKSIDEFINIINYDSSLSEQEKQDNIATAKRLKEYFNEYNTSIIPPIFAAALGSDLPAIQKISTEASSLMTEFSGLFTSIIDNTTDRIADTSQNTINQSDMINIVLVVVCLVLVLFVLILSIVISNAITRPIQELVDVAKNISKGNLNINIRTDRKDETGMLSQEFSNLVTTLKNLMDDFSRLSNEHSGGNSLAEIDSSVYEGSYQEIAKGASDMVQRYVLILRDLLNCLRGFGSGNFDMDIKKYPGRLKMLNDSMDALRENLRSVSSETNTLVNAALDGDLSKRSDDSAFEGEWKKIVSGLNKVMEAIAFPLQESTDVMRMLSKGDFSHKVNGNYKGEFEQIKSSLNETVENISSYIKEISSTLTELSHNNFTVQIDRPYIGEFSQIKNAVNSITDQLNTVIGEINSATTQVASGAKQISESSARLAEGASVQASSVQELSVTIEAINGQTAKNAENAANANALSESSKRNAEAGNKEMKNMLVSMEGIKTSSSNISKIIKTIEDIAFQTNLLALNAAVEAARAGEHGKGFAVVAEEVRNLAARSQTAAQETTSLIEDSISKVNAGTQIAVSTANSLETIVSDVNKVSSIISDIAKSSVEQANSILQVTTGLAQISDVVQSNSATSEESAAAAEELSGQSETLSSTVSVFKLKRA